MLRTLAAVVATALVACGGTIDPAGGGDDDGGGLDGAPPPAEVDIQGPDVLPHVQRYANEVCAATGACAISTYEGHSPTADRALDIRASDVYGELPTDDNALGNAVAEHALAHQGPAGITYVIWRQRINLGSGWRDMEDRGSITQNHYDHVHISFEETAP